MSRNIGSIPEGYSSGITTADKRHEVYVNTSSGDWCYYSDGVLVCTGEEGVYPYKDIKQLYNEIFEEEL